MHTSVGAWVETGFILFSFFVIAPSIAATIGYAAWNGKPKSFDREMYWTAFVFSGAVAGLIFVYTQRNGATWPLLVRVACFEIAALLFGVALGFGVGILTRRSSSLPE
jgi:hypothetical protein